MVHGRNDPLLGDRHCCCLWDYAMSSFIDKYELESMGYIVLSGREVKNN
jgi:hypothetical protein